MADAATSVTRGGGRERPERGAVRGEEGPPESKVARWGVADGRWPDLAGVGRKGRGGAEPRWLTRPVGDAEAWGGPTRKRRPTADQWPATDLTGKGSRRVRGNRDPFLLLTGPSRAIVAADTVKFEVELRIMYAGADPKDTVLFSSTYNYYSMQQYANPRIRSCCGMLELSVERLTRAVQATIVGVRVVEGEWPFQYGCRVSCYLSPNDDLVPTTPTEVVLVNCKVEEMEKQSGGYVNLSRNVVSVQLEQTLKVVIQLRIWPGI
ncbi:hypothetical protein ZWY2020_012345 [Hordeum vulgare]|nr:hypothetical protein ZWY2020_012345 [Hordeum vulgare]